MRLRYIDSELNGNAEGTLDLWRAVGSPIGTWTNQGATTRDGTNNWVELTSVTGFSDWTLASPPSAPTAVKLKSFTATKDDAGNVVIQWQSGYEIRNLGYNVYREQNGQRTRLTPSLVAGSALVAGRQTAFTAGFGYTWYDDAAAGGKGEGAKGKGETAAIEVKPQPSGDATYWLEDVDLNGTRTLHGPIAIADCGMRNADCEKIQERSLMLGETMAERAEGKGQGAAGRGQRSGVIFREWPAAFAGQLAGTRAPRSANPNDLALQRKIETRQGIKIAVSGDGWYRVTQPELIAAGLDPGANAAQLQLYVNGRPVAIKQSGDGQTLKPSDYLEFYGRGVDSPTETAQTYFLVINPDTFGTRIGDLELRQLPPPAVGATSFAYTVERKEREIYFSSLLNGDAENFFGQVVSSDAISETLPIGHLDPGSPAQLKVVLQGVTSDSHLVQVKFNGADLGTISFANTGHPEQTFNVPAAALLNGDNHVELTALGGAADVSLVDKLQLTYAHRYAADNDSLRVTITSSGTQRLSGFTTANIRVVDITDPVKMLELTKATRVNADADGSYSVDLQVPGAGFRNARTLVAFTDATAQAAAAVRQNNPSSWWSQTSGADYLIVTSHDFMASVEPLAQLRRNQGMVVNVIDVEDLYDEYSFGLHTPQAMKDFLQTTQSTWVRKPHFALFAGDASYDPKNYFGQGPDLVPTKLIDTTLMETASDDWFADFEADGVADLADGRLPARTVADTDVIVGKIINYENMTPDPTRGAMMVADNSFEAASSSVQALLPAGMPVEVINRSSADDATIHNQIITTLNQGPKVANYFGHGSNGVWTGASLLSSPDAATLTNQNRLSLFMMMTCFNGYFQDPYNDSLSEALLKAPNGAVAVWASTALTDPAGQTAVDQELYRQLFGNSPPTLGDAVRTAKQATGDQDVRRTWMLFGDPAMRLR